MRRCILTLLNTDEVFSLQNLFALIFLLLWWTMVKMLNAFKAFQNFNELEHTKHEWVDRSKKCCLSLFYEAGLIKPFSSSAAHSWAANYVSEPPCQALITHVTCEDFTNLFSSMITLTAFLHSWHSIKTRKMWKVNILSSQQLSTSTRANKWLDSSTPCLVHFNCKIVLRRQVQASITSCEYFAGMNQFLMMLWYSQAQLCWDQGNQLVVMRWCTGTPQHWLSSAHHGEHDCIMDSQFASIVVNNYFINWELRLHQH